MPQSARSVTTPTDGQTITADTRLAPGVYALPAGLTIAVDGVTLDGNGATLVGHDRQGVGIAVNGRRGVTIRNVRLRDYCHGIAARQAHSLTIEHSHITSTAEVASNTIFLDIWRDATHTYGGAILLERVTAAEIRDNDLQHQMNGLLSYGCTQLDVRRNNASYNSGYGFHLYETSESVFEANCADYCCRYEPRDRPTPRIGAGATGHMGADATGFLIVNNSCRNVFRRNFARLGGDGFFLAGRHANGTDVPCNDNLFEENDGSLSPNIAFEATFSGGNIFRGNRADRCNYGFWLGYSRDCELVGNRMVHNRQAGIAVENGARSAVHDNVFRDNHIAGILLWSQYVAKWFEDCPDNRTVHDWQIENCRLLGNGVGIAIRADRDHGVRPVPPEACGRPETRPHDIAIRGNDIQDNRVGIQLLRADRTLIERNTITRNVEADLRREDDRDTQIVANLGLYGP